MVAGFGVVRRQAIDLAQAASAMSLAGIPRRDRAGIYRDLLDMEKVALELLHE